MAKQIAKLLKASIQETSDLKEIAKMLAKKGRGGDTMLAHITPKEAAVLKESGGAGTVNPDTGLLEFYDGFNIADYADFDMPNIRTGGYATKAQPELSYGFNAPETYEYSDPTQQKAIDQYRGSATPYPAVSPNQTMDDRFAAQAIAETEFPSGMGARRDLLAEQGAAPISYGDWLASPAGQEYARQAGLADIGIATQQAGFAAAPTTPESSALQRYVGDPLKALQKATGITGSDLLRVGLAGAGAVAGRQQSQQAAKQIQQAVQEQKQLGAPYQQKGAELQRAAQAGELTPQSAQAYQALRAQMAQGVESRGGVGVAQAQAQLEAFRQNLLQNQYNFGLQVSQIGDQIALGAIRTGMQLDQQLGQANQQFYSQLAAIAGGGTYGYQPPQQTRGQ